MKSWNFKTLIWALLMNISSTLFAQDIWFSTSTGDNIYLAIQNEDSFFNVMQQLVEAYQVSNEQDVMQGTLVFSTDSSDLNNQYAINLAIADRSFIPAIIASAYSQNTPRNYYAPLSNSDKADIREIIMTLATVSTAGLLFHQGDLEKAGNRIKPIHPLRFLEYVFTTPELRGNVGNIKPKGSWVWGKFIGGLGNTLSEETNRGNMKDEYILDFASKVKIDPNLLYPAIRQKNWEQFVDLLITKIPRPGNPNRYNS